MAIVKFAAPVAGLRGKLGGVIYSANKAGPYVKPWASTSNPRSALQGDARAALAAIPALWQATSSSQKSDWADFAALPAQELTNPLGEAYYVSGYAWFTKCNARLAKIGRSSIDDAPSTARPSAPSITAFQVLPSGDGPNIAPGGTPQYSTEDSPTHTAAMAFDEDAATYWASTSAVGQYIGIILSGGPYQIAHYAIQAGPSGSQGYAPKDWNFQYWTGSAWSTVQSVTGETAWAAGETRFYVPTTFPSASLWRILISDTNDASGLARVSEFEFYELAEGRAIITYPAGDFASTDLVLFISQAATPTRLAFYSGFYSTVQSQSPAANAVEFADELLAVFGTVTADRSFGARLHRQTSEGIRSAPVASSCVS